MELLDLLQIPPLKQVSQVKASQVEGALHTSGKCGLVFSPVSVQCFLLFLISNLDERERARERGNNGFIVPLPRGLFFQYASFVKVISIL